MKKVAKHRRPLQLHVCLKHVMRVCRLVGFFPVEGISDSHPRNVKFNLKSIYTLYHVGTTATLVFNWFSLLYTSIFTDSSIFYDDIPKLLFSTASNIVAIMLYGLAKQWPKLIKAAADIEQSLADLEIPNGVYLKTKLVSYTIVGLAAVDHILYAMFKVKLVLNCMGQTSITFEVFEIFFRYNYRHIFNYIPYNFLLGIFVEGSEIQNLFLWNVSDLMGMCFSIYLKTYFESVGKMINSDKPNKDWAKLRAFYSRVVVLLNLINDRMAPFILLSCINNLIFICLQLFSSIHGKKIEHKLCKRIPDSLDHAVIAPAFLMFYVFSFCFLTLRSMGFAYLATSVHTSANKAVLALYDVPTSEYNQEVQLFQMQIRYTTIGLCGVFFYIKRKMILRVIATIITYELVLLQFSYNNDVNSTLFTTYHFHNNNTNKIVLMEF